MREGDRCHLNVSTCDASSERQSPPYATVTGVVVGERRHLDDAARVLYYFHTTRVERVNDVVATDRKSSSSGGGATGLLPARRKKEELFVGTHALNSSSGFKYTFDGWYDEEFFYKVDEEVVPVDREWRFAMQQDTAPCELLYLSYATRPWFHSPFSSLQYVHMPDRHLCYSVSVCHRCLSPFFSRRHLQEHLLGYCRCRGPPGVILYNDTESGRRVFYVDGAKHLQYSRCLCLLGKAFLESKQVENDVDIYEFFVVTMQRASLPYVFGEMDESSFRREATLFDAAQWDGDVVVGYFSRIKHTLDHCLSCIVTLPVFQQQGIGFFMLDVAYRLTALRQTLCGCKAACGTHGGAISRPFSPHGQALLMAYWRQRVTEALLHKTLSEDKGSEAAAVAMSFRQLHEMVLAGGCYIHEEDLKFFAMKDDRCFYARVASDVAFPVAYTGRKAAAGAVATRDDKVVSNDHNNGSNKSSVVAAAAADTGDEAPLEFAPPPPDFIGSLLLFKSDVAQGRRKSGAFDERFWACDVRGRHPYCSALFHY